jgi:hypothetical protein
VKNTGGASIDRADPRSSIVTVRPSRATSTRSSTVVKLDVEPQIWKRRGVRSSGRKTSIAARGTVVVRSVKLKAVHLYTSDRFAAAAPRKVSAEPTAVKSSCRSPTVPVT